MNAPQIIDAWMQTTNKHTDLHDDDYKTLVQAVDKGLSGMRRQLEGAMNHHQGFTAEIVRIQTERDLAKKERDIFRKANNEKLGALWEWLENNGYDHPQTGLTIPLITNLLTQLKQERDELRKSINTTEAATGMCGIYSKLERELDQLRHTAQEMAREAVLLRQAYEAAKAECDQLRKVCDELADYIRAGWSGTASFPVLNAYNNLPHKRQLPIVCDAIREQTIRECMSVKLGVNSDGHAADCDCSICQYRNALVKKLLL